jgi:IS605 OrfB family transposase
MQTRWIGVDLNTTGHAVVAADPIGGTVLKLGKKLHYQRTSSMNCTKLYHENKLWKLKKTRSREKKEFRAALHKIARQIVGFAGSRGAGIKFEKLFSYRHTHSQDTNDSCEFSLDNGSFVQLLDLVEKRALNYGVPVRYVNPLNTSKKCSRCGAFGKRIRKRFECPKCGRVIHADVNAALNIAVTPCHAEWIDLSCERASRKMMRKLARAEKIHPGCDLPAIPDFSPGRDILSLWNDCPMPGGEAG